MKLGLNHGCRLALAVITSLALVSCLDREITVFVNPDGSGKIIAVLKELKGSSAAASASRAVMQSYRGRHGLAQDMGMDTFIAAQFIGGTEGVEAWTNYRVEKDAEGRATVMIRGYFKDINKLKVGGFQRSDKLGASDETPTISMSNAPDGSQLFQLPNSDPLVVLNVLCGGEDGGDEKPSTDTEVSNAIEGKGQQFKSVKLMAGGGIKLAHLKVSIQPSGKINNLGAFAEAQGNQAFVEIGGQAMLDLIEHAAVDESLRRSMVLRQPLTEDTLKQARIKLLGNDRVCELRTEKGAAQFDYQTELKHFQSTPSPEIPIILDMVQKMIAIEKAEGINLFGRQP